MENKVPTMKIKVGKGDEQVEVEVRKWLTQEQDDQYNEIITGHKDIEFDTDEGESIKMSTSLKSVSDAKKFLIESMCVSLKWEDFNYWNPELREQLFKEIEIIRSLKKK